MSVETYPHLFQPIRIGKTIFRNRIFAAPTAANIWTGGTPPPPRAWPSLSARPWGALPR